MNIGDIVNFREDPKGAYLDRYAARADPLKPEHDYIKNLYSQSVGYVATQISRLIEHIKRVGLFDDALIIITGDHGEEFGERGFYGHNSLYDANIRPFMAIKPPEGVDWPDDIGTVDHIDFLPTIAELIDTTPPESVQGIPIQDQRRSGRPRITERIRPDSYSVSVEVENTKAIFTYEGNFPYRPDGEEIADGPMLSEFYDVSKVRDRDYSDIGDVLTGHEKNKFDSIAESFIDSDNHAIAHYTDLDITGETDALLEDLGYK